MPAGADKRLEEEEEEKNVKALDDEDIAVLKIFVRLPAAPRPALSFR